MATRTSKAKAVAVPTIDFTGAPTGFEGTDEQDYAIPFLRIVQKISPEVDETSSRFKEDAKPGMFINTVTGDLFDGKKGVLFVPAAYQRRFLRWEPREQGGGFKGSYLPEDVKRMEARGEAVADGISIECENGDLLRDTRSHFGLILDEKGEQIVGRVVLALASTQIKKSRQIMTALQQVRVETAKGDTVTPPTYYSRLRLQSVPESNDQGSWYGLKMEIEGNVQETPHLFAEARAFNESVNAGEVRVNYAAEKDEEASEAF